MAVAITAAGRAAGAVRDGEGGQEEGEACAATPPAAIVAVAAAALTPGEVSSGEKGGLYRSVEFDVRHVD